MTPRPGATFWAVAEDLIARHTVRIDRPRGSRHPRFPDVVYPLDYGFLEATSGGDGEGIDLWIGTRPGAGLIGAFVTADPHKADMEVKLVLDAGADDVATLECFYPPAAAGCPLRAASLIGTPPGVGGRPLNPVGRRQSPTVMPASV